MWAAARCCSGKCRSGRVHKGPGRPSHAVGIPDNAGRAVYSPAVMSSESNPKRLSADWAAVLVAAVLVALAAFGVLPAIPFLVK